MAGHADLSRIAAAVSTDLAAAGIEHVLTGALALAIHARPRQTEDIDVVVAVPSLRLPEVFAVARTHGFAGEDRRLIEEIRARSFAQMTAGPLTLDVIVPVLPWHGEVVRRAVRCDVAGTSVPLVTAEDLFVMKVLWHRPKDVADLQILAALGPRLDAAYVRTTLASLVPPGDPRHAEVERLLGT